MTKNYSFRDSFAKYIYFKALKNLHKIFKFYIKNFGDFKIKKKKNDFKLFREGYLEPQLPLGSHYTSCEFFWYFFGAY